MNRTQFTVGGEDDTFNWQPEPEAGEEGQGEGEQPPEEPALPDLDDETMAAVEAYYTRRQEQQRARLQEYGMDLASDGQPVVRDPSKFSAWATPVASPGRGQAPPAPPPPDPRTTPVAAEDPLPVDLMALSGPEQVAAIERIVQRATATLVQQNQELRGQLQRRTVREAMAGVRQAVEQYSPEIAWTLDHPEFAVEYQRQAQTMDPVSLENPQMQAALAGAVRATLSISPTTPPQWGPQQQQGRSQPQYQEQPRDEQGRFQEVARNIDNRRNVGQVAGSRAGMAPPGPRDQMARETERFIGQFREFASGKVSKKPVTSREVDILTSPTESDFGENVNYLEWKTAMDQDNARNGRR